MRKGGLAFEKSRPVVVRAVQGDMRERPKEPGGQLARNTGLAVNEVAGVGEASGPVDQVVLAPRPTELRDEDQPMIRAMVAPEASAAPPRTTLP